MDSGQIRAACQQLQSNECGDVGRSVVGVADSGPLPHSMCLMQGRRQAAALWCAVSEGGGAEGPH